jgi:hypothetical protein
MEEKSRNLMKVMDLFLQILTYKLKGTNGVEVGFEQRKRQIELFAWSFTF